MQPSAHTANTSDAEMPTNADSTTTDTASASASNTAAVNSAAVNTAAIDQRIATIRRQPFRAKFHLRVPESEFVALRGADVVARHARDLIGRRLAPAHPANDGRQTPWGGHPVFRAQHATATCCRSCLARNHDIPKGRELTAREQDYVVAVICRWIDTEIGAARPSRT
ncbi:hypothetical protein GCM10027169_16690 [Gordonia jinhuaensis]|uniref:DUF4186 domain-containing protein n=1 Tax=Gordonia jinhuaensis TaxID=1517702 RepID=A0A916TK26_9ACTN|nr:DUF4186 domain-containing protein [Gordonia jinhuaensis]GGB48119.1 hypothetical protein GCM10011489_39070 [Gordonia jinhuaensis]